MRTWTLVFIGVVLIVLLAVEKSSNEWLLVATRIGVATVMITSILAGVRALTRPWKEPFYAGDDLPELVQLANVARPREAQAERRAGRDADSVRPHPLRRAEAGKTR